MGSGRLPSARLEGSGQPGVTGRPASASRSGSGAVDGGRPAAGRIESGRPGSAQLPDGAAAAARRRKASPTAAQVEAAAAAAAATAMHRRQLAATGLAPARYDTPTPDEREATAGLAQLVRHSLAVYSLRMDQEILRGSVCLPAA